MALNRSGCRYAHTLFNVGSVGGLTDGELLGLFISRRDEAGELAFTVLVEPPRAHGHARLPVDPAG